MSHPCAYSPFYYIFICMYTHTHTHTHTHTRTHTHTICVYVCMYVCVCVCNIYVCMHEIFLVQNTFFWKMFCPEHPNPKHPFVNVLFCLSKKISTKNNLVEIFFLQKILLFFSPRRHFLASPAYCTTLQSGWPPCPAQGILFLLFVLSFVFICIVPHYKVVCPLVLRKGNWFSRGKKYPKP